MCRLFVEADARLWETRLKSLRMNGLSTSVRLENFYWQVLEEIAGRDGLTVSRLLARLYDEVLAAHGTVENFASFLRVCCGRYLALQRDGEVPRDLSVPLSSLDADGLLTRETARAAARAGRARDAAA